MDRTLYGHVLVAVAFMVCFSEVKTETSKFEIPSPGDEHCANIWWIGFSDGYVYSHPQNMATYGENYNCSVHIDVGHPFQSINVTFIRFSMQKPEAGVCVDYVRFFSDDGLMTPLTDPLCGEFADMAQQGFVVRKEKFLIQMVSNGVTQASGFTFYYKSFNDFHGLNPDDIFIHGPGGSGGNGGGASGSHSMLGEMNTFLLITSLLFVNWSQ